VSDKLVLLEVVDGVCSGARHRPAPFIRDNGRTISLDGRIEQAHGVPPLMWFAQCGAYGMLYLDAPILARRPACFGCMVKSVYRKPRSAPYRYESEAERLEARRQTWRESKRRMREAG
jgi:hypothetical protein